MADSQNRPPVVPTASPSGVMAAPASEARRDRIVTVVVIVAIVIAVAVAIVMALRGATVEPIGPAVEPSLAPAPSAAAAPMEAPFNESVPTEPSRPVGPK